MGSPAPPPGRGSSEPDGNSAGRALDQAAAARFRALVTNARDVFVALGPDLTINWISPSVQGHLGHEPADLVGVRLPELITSTYRPVLELFLDNRKERMVSETVELEVHTQTRRTRLVEATLSDVPPETMTATGDAWVMTWTDRTEQRQLERALRKQSLYDALTGLATRTTLHFELQQKLQMLSRQEYLGVIHLDLNDFRPVNESIGFERGDELLQSVAARLRSSLRATDVLARLGGNEFGVATVADHPKALVAMARRVASLFEHPFEVGERQVTLAVSLGMTLTGDRRAVASDLLDQAALALGAAKGNPAEPIRVYESMMRVTATERFELGSDLVGAAERGELRLVYQPIVNLGTGVVEEVEALLRWVHPERGPISPATFIPLAERSGLIVEVGRWVMGEACRQIHRWHDQRPVDAGSLSVSVNVSARQLELPGEAERLIDVVTGSGLDPRFVTAELTESTFLDDPTWMHDQLGLFRQAGMRVAIDDFGTGAAGLGHLRDVPFTMVKIDKSYVDALRRSEEGTVLVQGVIELAHALGARTVAEGVEEAADLELLAALGCDLVQGFHLGRPMEPTQLEDWLTAWPERAQTLPSAGVQVFAEGEPKAPDGRPQAYRSSISSA